MKNITEQLDDIYLPEKALVIYRSQAGQNETIYVEAYDMDEEGTPMNAHPLSVKETIGLAEGLNKSAEVQTGYLESAGLLPDKLLHVNHAQGCAVWYTPEQKANLLFVEQLKIPCGKAAVPALVWKADRDRLSVFALKDNKKPKESSHLYHAPFFNVYDNGNICMGTVDIDNQKAECIEAFMEAWEQSFWNSYFSHLNVKQSPVKGNIIQLWQDLTGSEKTFPKEVLIKQGRTIKDILR